MKVALFVEGGQDVPPPRGDAPLFEIWNKTLPEALGLQRFDLIVPITKKHLIAMDPSKPPMSGAGEGLDQLMVRKGLDSTFHAALVAWDLVPAWNPQANLCRRQETLDLYRHLANSAVLPPSWRDQARQRWSTLSARASGAVRGAPPRLRPGLVLPLCMVWMFESLLVGDQAAARRAFGVEGQPVRGWPDGWGDPAQRRPDQDILAPAVRSVCELRPRPAACPPIPKDLRRHKNDWGAWLLRALLDDPQAADGVKQHPICARLAEIAPAQRG